MNSPSTPEPLIIRRLDTDIDITCSQKFNSKDGITLEIKFGDQAVLIKGSCYIRVDIPGQNSQEFAAMPGPTSIKNLSLEVGSTRNIFELCKALPLKCPGRATVEAVGQEVKAKTMEMIEGIVQQGQ